MKRLTAKVAESNLLDGDKLYLKRARITLPYLVRQAKAGQTISYTELAEEIGIVNPRNLNYVLGSIGRALIKLSKRTKVKIPLIQCLVVNKTTGLPGEGFNWFINEKKSNLSKSQIKRIVDGYLVDIYTFQSWEWVLKQLNLEPIKTDMKPEIEKAKKLRGNGGESSDHYAFKNFIANNPTVIGIRSESVKIEYCLPTGDAIDVLFTDNNTKIGVEVKSKISSTPDILRGLFQSVKYKYLIEAEQIVNDERPDSRVILVLEGSFPTELVVVKNLLGIEVIDKIETF